MDFFRRWPIGMKRRRIQRKFKKVRADYLRLVSDLTQKGLSLNEAFGFCAEIDPRFAAIFQQMQRKIAYQTDWPALFANFGLNEGQKTQLGFAFYHGNLPHVLQSLAQQVEDQQQRKQEVGKALSYPLFLLGMTSLVGLMMRLLLRPQLQQNGFAQQTQLFTPPLVWGSLGLLIVVLALGGASYGTLRKLSYLERVTWYTKIPFLGGALRLYYTSLFAAEWGQLLVVGFDAKAIVEGLVKQKGNRFFKELAHAIAQRFYEGNSMAISIGDWPFLTPEFAALVRRGEQNSRLGPELSIYSRRCWQQLLRKIDFSITFIQPLCFMGIALVMIRLYAGMLLPLYQQMEGLL